MPSILCVWSSDSVLMQLHGLLTPVALGAAALLFGLLALRDEVHFFAVGFGDALSYYAFVEAPQQLLDGLSIASFDFHCCLTVANVSGLGFPRASNRSYVVALTSPRVR